jgi:hypothetical protein
VGETPSRRRIFSCKPKGPGEETPCATRILTPIVRRAFRRDVSDSDLQPFLRTYKATRGKLGFEQAIAAAIRDVLLAPDFLFRLEFDAPDARPGSLQPVSPFELASRLSFFLWSSIPDDDLLNLASSGKLSDGKVRDATVRRMLADPRAAALADNFAAQWLGLHALGDVEPDRQLYPEFDAALAAAFNQETRMFVRSLIRENRSVLDLLNADYTYLKNGLPLTTEFPASRSRIPSSVTRRA